MSNSAGRANWGNSQIPASAGVGLKPQHFNDILDGNPGLGWFEIHPENYLMAGGPMHHFLGKIRERYPLSFHSVGMSPGSAEGIDEAHVMKIKALAERYQPGLISDHLSWSRWGSKALNDLLPLPWTEQALQVMVDNVDHIQNLLGRTIAIENPSSYVELACADMDECDFLLELSRHSGAGILLDLNNIHVSACNHGWSAQDYLQRIPSHQVVEFHLAGHKIEQTAYGLIRIDDHGSAICREVWTLFEQALGLIGQRPVLIEWDMDIPDFNVLEQEAAAAGKCMAAHQPLQAVSHG